MTLSGAVRIDLSDLDAQGARRRCGVLRMVPDHARVILIVGAVAPPFEAASLVAEHAARVDIDVQGEPNAVRSWLNFLSGNDRLGLAT